MAKLRITFNTRGEESPSVVISTDLSKEQIKDTVVSKLAVSQSVSFPNNRNTAVYTVLKDNVKEVIVSDTTQISALKLEDITFN
ncbi:hypothetical protein Q0O28_28645 [Bacillus thuringiensis]|uniref:hypothetical protein n=1 Tax=Bacillus thuringiensis TaxID=1428 RepID=UPI00345ACCCA